MAETDVAAAVVVADDNRRPMSDATRQYGKQEAISGQKSSNHLGVSTGVEVDVASRVVEVVADSLEPWSHILS